MHVTEAEWEVMEAVWRKDRQVAGEVIAEVQSRRDWSHRTIRTLLARLVEKQAVQVEIDGGKYLYRASVSRSQCVKTAAESFQNQFFGGDVKSMLMHFVENEELSTDEIRDLEKLLRSHRQSDRSDGVSRKSKSKNTFLKKD